MKWLALILLHSFKLWAADTLPFAYLNQHFRYEYLTKSSFKINNDTYSFTDIALALTVTGVQVSVKDTSQFKTTNTTIEALDKNGKTLESFPISVEQKEFSKKLFSNLTKINAICLTGINEFTVKKMCVKILKTATQNMSDLVFSANGVTLNPFGQIILNNTIESLKFKVENSDYFFELTTGYKNIIPNRAYKLEKSNALQVDFADLNQPNKYNFKRTINLSDTFIEIATDDLISVQQDIIFSTDDLFAKSIDYEFKNWKIRKYNKLGLEPIILFAQLTVDSTLLSAKIISDLSKGVKIYFTHYPNNTFEYYYSGKLMLLQLNNDINKNVINNNTLSLLSAEGGARYYLSSDFHYEIKLALQELVYAELEPVTQSVNIVRGITPTVAASVNSVIYELFKFRFQASGGIGLISPTNIPSGQTQTAFNITLGTQLSYKLRGGRLYYGAEYSSYSTSNSVYKYNHQSLEHKIGFYYLY